MTSTARIREVFERAFDTNHISGHSWIVHAKTTNFQVLGASGPVSTHNTFEKADKEREKLQKFYDKFNL